MPTSNFEFIFLYAVPRYIYQRYHSSESHTALPRLVQLLRAPYLQSRLVDWTPLPLLSRCIAEISRLKRLAAILNTESAKGCWCQSSSADAGSEQLPQPVHTGACATGSHGICVACTPTAVLHHCLIDNHRLHHGPPRCLLQASHRATFQICRQLPTNLASINTCRTGTSTLVMSTSICSSLLGISVTNNWFVRSAAITLPLLLSKRALGVETLPAATTRRPSAASPNPWLKRS